MLKDAVTAVAISIWIGALFGVLASLLVAACYLPHPAAMCWLGLMVRRPQISMLHVTLLLKPPLILHLQCSAFVAQLFSMGCRWL